MKKILFICHGNICRSAAAEYICKFLLNKYKLEEKYFVFSRGTSNEEYGNDIYPPMKNELRKNNIPFSPHFARKVTKHELDSSDYIYYMDQNNLRNLLFIDEANKEKYKLICCLNKNISYIEDPWYTGNFDLVFSEIYECIETLIKEVLING